MFEYFSPLIILIFFQIIFEVLPLSSSTITSLVEKIFLDYQLSSFERSLLDLSNILSDFVPLLFFRKRFTHLLALRVDDFFAGANGIVKSRWAFLVDVIFLAGLANFMTMLCYFVINFFEVDKTGIVPSSVLINLIFSAFAVASVFLKDKYYAAPAELISINKAVVLGLFQGLALLKGISRLGITFAIGRWLNLSEKQALLFSYLLHFQISIAYYIKFCSQYGFFAIFANFTWQGFLITLVGLLFSYFGFWLTYLMAIRKYFYIYSLFYLGAIFGVYFYLV